MYFLGYDLGSSSVKASIVEASTGQCKASVFYPDEEMEIIAHKNGWAEQEPELWWKYLCIASREVISKASIPPQDIKGIGISYQMHGLVMIDKNGNPIRPSIIWCDSRAVDIGHKAFEEIGGDYCLKNLLNSPGNFTASKLKWVKDNEPHLFEKIDKIMLPGDFMAMKMTGEINTTISGLSEGIFWNYKENKVDEKLLSYYGIPKEFIPDIKPTFSIQGKVTKSAADQMGLTEGVPVAYRAGDQPNNAFSLNVLNPGEIAATAGTSGVVYGVSEEIKYDPESRVNTFAHVNYTSQNPKLGVLLCINGTGILNSWLKHNIGNENIEYSEINENAAKVPIGSEGLTVLPFGNGAERMLNNKELGSHFMNLNFNIHKNTHVFRAAQEGIVFAFHYGLEIMKQTGIVPEVIRAGNANMFLSPIFRETLASVTEATIELYDTDGALGAAKGAGFGIGHYNSFSEAFQNFKKIKTIAPDTSNTSKYQEAYNNWKEFLHQFLMR
jgi:xylulokinase